MKIITYIALIFALTITIVNASDTINVSAPVTTDLAGKTGKEAVESVVRIIATETNTAGTGFMHKSGKIITAAHVVSNNTANKIIILFSNGRQIPAKDVIKDDRRDLAIITPATFVKVDSLKLSIKESIPVGLQVSTWGFPSGYSGLSPLLTVGYVSGLDYIESPVGTKEPRFVVNAAFNSGNSGGPVLDLENGSVIGVVSSKLAPVPDYIIKALEVLKSNRSGLNYTGTKPDGSKITISESQLVGDVLTYLRSQTQLVIGHAVLAKDVYNFLKENNIEP
jgi:S1-C subfamily serine protease